MAANNPVTVEVPVHQMSTSASSAALLAHHDHKEYEVPDHQLSANAGRAALLAHQDHKEYQVPAQTLSANAGKAALMAHRDSASAAPQKVNATSAASAASALRAATQAHHDPAMRPTKPEDLQAKGAANALRAASQAHREAPSPFKYVHPADDPEVGRLARSNTQGYLADMEPRAPHRDTVAYAGMSYNSAKAREGQADTYRAISDEAYRSAGLSYATQSNNGDAAAAATGGRSRTNTASTVNNNNKAPVDLMALARKNVDAQMAERGLSRTGSQQSVSTIGTASRGANLAFRDGQGRQAESDRQREAHVGDREITERINREMAQFDQQRRRNQDSSQVQSALMEAAKRNARLSMARMEANRPYSAPNLRDTQRLEDLLNEERLRARRDRPDGAQVDIGGGHFMSQLEIEAVAARRIQPVMEEMDEQVAEMNRRRAEIQAQREADQARREAERAEHRRLKELERERERNTKAAEKAARAETKAREAAERDERDRRRREELETKRAADRERRREHEAAERTRREEQRLPQQQQQQQVADHDHQALERTESAEAVATAQTTTTTTTIGTDGRDVEEDGPLPGTNAPIVGQDVNVDEGVVHSNDGPALRRSETMESADEEVVATYQVETRGMMTDTEGETDDEWADAMEETPAIERAEYVTVQRLTDLNLASRNAAVDTTPNTRIIREEEEEEDDVETASVATAKPGRTDDFGEENQAQAGVVVMDDDDDDDDEIAPPLAIVRSNVALGTGVHNHEQTRFKEELA